MVTTMSAFTDYRQHHQQQQRGYSFFSQQMSANISSNSYDIPGITMNSGNKTKKTSFLASSLIDESMETDVIDFSENLENIKDLDAHLSRFLLQSLRQPPSSELGRKFLAFVRPYCRSCVPQPPFLRATPSLQSGGSRLLFILDHKTLLSRFLQLYTLEKYEQTIAESLRASAPPAPQGNRLLSANNQESRALSSPLVHLEEMSSSIRDIDPEINKGIVVLAKGSVVSKNQTLRKNVLLGPMLLSKKSSPDDGIDLDPTTDEHNWMLHVGSTPDKTKQNLHPEVVEGRLFFRVMRDVGPGKKLLTAPSLRPLMLAPFSGGARCGLVQGKSRTGPVSAGDLLPEEASVHNGRDKSEEKEGFSCERCGKMFAYEYYRAKHLKYTRCVDQGDRKYPCDLCTRSFEKRDRLRIHVLHVHEKHRPHKCGSCGKSFSQSSSLNKHLRVHSGERPYKCDYCDKAFTASSILRTHIRQHSGEKPFKCKHCLKSFASHAAHDSHVRRTHAAVTTEMRAPRPP